ncbi:unnamed protein product, partial [Rotaria sp. Silwood2]
HNKVKISPNPTDIITGGVETGNITTNGERIFNVLGYGSTLQEAQIQSVLACEYIKQQMNIDDLFFKTDIGSQAIEWYKAHYQHPNSTASGLTNGKKKKFKKKKIISTTPTKPSRGITTRGQNLKTSEQIEDDNNETNDEDDDDDDDDSEPMDFERAFGSVSDIPKLEYMNIYENNKITDGLHNFEGESYFDLSTKIDLKTYAQPVLVSSTINLNPLAAVR